MRSAPIQIVAQFRDVAIATDRVLNVPGRSTAKYPPTPRNPLGRSCAVAGLEPFGHGFGWFWDWLFAGEFIVAVGGLPVLCGLELVASQIVRPSDVGSTEIGPAEVREVEVGPSEIRLDEISLDELGLFKFRSIELRLKQSCPGEIRPQEPRMA